MEFPEIGKSCALENCHQLDFLPFECEFCKNVFCKDHFLPESHSCSSVVLKKHSTTNIGKNFICTITDCRTKDVVEMLCVKCKSHFCLLHRYHDCFKYTPEEIEEARKKLSVPQEQYKKSLKEVNTQIDLQIERSMKNVKKQQMAFKVQLMRLKGKAVGPPNVPTEERVYFLIYPPKELKTNSKAIYCSTQYTVGRNIDAIASLCNTNNRNNEANANKLRLFRKRDGEILSSEMSDKLSTLLSNGVVSNGESLILEYVPHNQSSKDIILPNFLEYTD